MDALTHTLIATGCIAVAFYAGHFFGHREGRIAAWLHLCLKLGASGILVSEEGTITVQYPDGTEEDIE